MSEYGLIDHKFLMGDDGLIANNFVGNWAIEKHSYLTRYLDISRSVRNKFVYQAGATYIDLFCATGRGLKVY